MLSWLGWQELLVILIIVLVIFGPSRLPELGRSLGKGIKEFKKSTSETQEQLTKEEPPAAAARKAGAETGAATERQPVEPKGSEPKDS